MTIIDLGVAVVLLLLVERYISKLYNKLQKEKYDYETKNRINKILNEIIDGSLKLSDTARDTCLRILRDEHLTPADKEIKFRELLTP